MLTQKFIEQPGQVTQLDGSQKSKDVQDLTLNGAKLIPAVDFGSPANGNPDGATGVDKLSPIPSVMQKPA
jgi:hypothetical protein